MALLTLYCSLLKLPIICSEEQEINQLNCLFNNFIDEEKTESKVASLVFAKLVKIIFDV